MNVLITGGAGFIGSNLTKFHIEKGDDVTVIDNLITGSKDNLASLFSDNKLHFIEADITQFDFSTLPPFNYIYHLASPASPVQYKKHSINTLITNAQGTYRVLNFLKESGSGTYVLASTSETYGDPLEHPQKETYWGNVNPVGIRSCYDEGKRFAEALSTTYWRTYSLNIRIARIFNTYGPNMEKDDGRVVSNFVTQSLQGVPITIYGDGTQTRSFCYVSDMIEGLYALMTTLHLEGEIINLGNPHEKTIRELATIIKEMTKSSSEIVTKPIAEDDPKKRKPDIAKAEKLLTWKPIVSLEDGLQKTIDYFKTRFV